jgi:tetrapyrrole methylase family protein / MazG family protein
MPSIRVIGLGGSTPSSDWSALIADRPLYVRSARVAQRHTPPGYTYTRTFDDIVHHSDAFVMMDSIVRALASAARDNDIAYLVPGAASVGDMTVVAVSKVSDVDIVPGTLSAPLSAQPVTIVDALALARAEHSAPFEAGVVSIDPGATLVVTNWFGDRVTADAANYLRRLYPGAMFEPDDEGVVTLAAVDFQHGARSLQQLLQLVARLRRRDGCPWDREQTAASMMPDLHEEVAELQAAIDSEDWENAAEELGDVLLHVVMQAQIAREAQRFSMDDIIGGLAEKLVRRHPHVFGDVSAASPEDVLAVWQGVKEAEKAARQRAGS